MVIIPKCSQVCHQENRVTLVPYSPYSVLLLMVPPDSGKSSPTKQQTPRV